MLLGPTAVGKTAVAVAAAERIGAEIVGCDALQVYRGFDVATAKPDPSERRRVPHHLVDHVDPRHDYTVAEYVRDADRTIAAIRARGRAVLVVGGTGMYLRGLLHGLVDAPARRPVLRTRIRGWIDRHGVGRVHRLLRRLDPDSAARIAPGDTQRLVRALEVRFVTGEPLGARIERDGTWRREPERFRALKVGLDMDRAVHRERIERRVDRFLQAGLVEEVRGLLGAGVAPRVNAFKAIGYRETLAAIESGPVDRRKLRDEIVVHTRQLAKRQRTWFRKEPDVLWLDAGRDPMVLADRVARDWRVHVEGA